MKQLGIAAIALSCLGLACCGGSVGRRGSAPAASTDSRTTAGSPTASIDDTPVTRGPLDTDDDNPRGTRYDGDDFSALHFGRVVDAAEAPAVTALVTRYFKAAAGEDAVEACPLVFWLLIEGVAEEHNRAPRTASQRARVCRELMPAVWRGYHQELVSDSKLRVLSVGFKGNRGLVLLTFGSTPERIMVIHRQDGPWEINNFTATGFP